MEDELRELTEKFEKFLQQYETDMRGDKSLNGGKQGIVGFVREIKKTQDDYPSLTWLFAHKPVPTVGAVLFIYIILTALSQLGMLKIFLTYFNVPCF